MLRTFFVSILLCAFGSLASAQVVPLFDAKSGGLLGGVRDGKFVTAAEAFKEISGSQNFTIISPLGGKRDFSATVSAPTEPCDDYYYVERDGGGELGVGIGKGLTWNPVPRPIKSIAPTNKIYLSVVTAVLRSKGLAKSKPLIEQAISGDFDGDGADEVLITASSYGGRISPSAKNGDYSFVILRKVVGGKVKNFVLAEEYIKKNFDFGAPSRFDVSGVADLNGDGRMEIVVFGEYYEGAGATVHQVLKSGVEEVGMLNASCGV